MNMAGWMTRKAATYEGDLCVFSPLQVSKSAEPHQKVL